MAYAYVCSQCAHLASRHYLVEGYTDIVTGPYLCSHRDCVCTISQNTPVSGISEDRFNHLFAGHLDDYE